jgi:FAD/FMN-containing dehydrogenase
VSISSRAVEPLRRDFKGHLIGPESDAYEHARAIWNGLIDKRPALIARCADSDDVASTLAFARDEELHVAIRGGGHSVAGLGTCDDGIVIDLSAMKRISVDPVGRTARAEGGALWGEVDRQTQVFGLAASAGVVSHTGIAGLTLGGGFGWLARKHGLACDNLISADLITADGERITAGPGEHKDLLWALKGGGGNFGVVTTFEYAVHPVGPTVLAGSLSWPIERAYEVWRFYRDWSLALPDEMSSGIGLRNQPVAHFVPTAARGATTVSVTLCHAGPIDEGERLIAELRDIAPLAFDDVRAMPYVAVNHMLDIPHGVRSYWKTGHIDDLSDGLLAELLAQFELAPSTQSDIFIEHLGGQVARIPAAETAFGPRGAAYRLILDTLWDDPDGDADNISWAHESGSKLKEFFNGDTYVNYLTEHDESDVESAYSDSSRRRLREIKTKYDPENFFRVNHNIKPFEPASDQRAGG